VYKEDLASGQQEYVEEKSVVMNLGQDVRIEESEKESVSTELEKSAYEETVTEQANIEVPSVNPVTMPRPC
jgi:hypothetical protein